MSMIFDNEYTPTALTDVDITQDEIEKILTDAAMWTKYKKEPLDALVRNKRRVSSRQLRALAIIGIKYLMADYVDEIQRQKENKEHVEEDNKG